MLERGAGGSPWNSDYATWPVALYYILEIMEYTFDDEMSGICTQELVVYLKSNARQVSHSEQNVYGVIAESTGDHRVQFQHS